MVKGTKWQHEKGAIHEQVANFVLPKAFNGHCIIPWASIDCCNAPPLVRVWHRYEGGKFMIPDFTPSEFSATNRFNPFLTW